MAASNISWKCAVLGAVLGICSYISHCSCSWGKLDEAKHYSVSILLTFVFIAAALYSSHKAYLQLYQRQQHLEKRISFPEDLPKPMEELICMELTRAKSRQSTRRFSVSSEKKRSRTKTTSDELMEFSDHFEEMRPIDSSPSLRGFVDDFSHWDFDMFDLAAKVENPLVVVGFTCLETFQTVNLDKATLIEFLRDAQDAYKDVIYHNSLHAATVARSAFSFCTALHLGTTLDEPLQFALVLSGIIHDIGHPGVTATFLSKIKDELSLTYSDDAPLERMHLATAFRLLRKNAFLDDETLALLKPIVTKAVLGTDMARHGEFMQRLNALIDNLQYGSGSGGTTWYWPLKPPPACKTPESKKEWEGQKIEEFVVEVFLHAADVASPAMPFDQFTRWNQLVNSEFHAQGDREVAEFGHFISVQDGYDRNVSPARLHNFTSGFVKFLVQPMYTMIHLLSSLKEDEANCARGIDMKICLDYIKTTSQKLDASAPEAEKPN